MINDKRSNVQLRKSFMGTALAVVFSAGLYAAAGLGGAHAQATGGSIFGSAPAGRTVTIQSSSGMNRHAKVNSSGHYRLGSLPLGNYSAILVENGKEVDMRSNIRLTVGGSAKVDFTCPEASCAASSNSKTP